MLCKMDNAVTMHSISNFHGSFLYFSWNSLLLLLILSLHLASIFLSVLRVSLNSFQGLKD